MPLRLPTQWVWDFWFAQDGADTHMFYLQAPRHLVQEHLRHWNVSIGHAVSQDLRQWQVLPDALAPSPPDIPEPFDNYTTWTGSIIRHKSLWWMFYTGSKRSEEGLVQRIGAATSTDLMTWQKLPQNPLIAADPTWYELLDRNAWHDQAWRDPWVFQDPNDGTFHAFITARVKGGIADARGVIGHAQSADLLQWDVLPPVTEPGEYGHMEVPQLVQIGGRYYLLFSVGHGQYSGSRRTRVGENLHTGTHYLMSNSPYSGYQEVEDAFLLGDAHGSLYSARLIEHNGTWYCMSFRNFSPTGEFAGEIADPIPVQVLEDGRLRLNRG